MLVTVLPMTQSVARYAHFPALRIIVVHVRVPGLLFVVVLIALLRYRESVRNRAYLTRNSLLAPDRSAWAKLWACGHDSELICTTGFDRKTFMRIAAEFVRVQGVAATGRPRLLDHNGQLGLVLHWLNSRMTGKNLCQIFGLPPATISRYLTEGAKNLLTALRQMPAARIRFPRPVRCFVPARSV
jgi:hypothetical protein